MDTEDKSAVPQLGSRKTLVRNALFNTSGWGVTVLLSLLATPYIVYKLGIEGYGVYALLTGLVGYYNLLDLGLGDGVTKFVAQYRAVGDDEGVNRSVNAALWVQICAGLAGSLLLIVLASPILRLLRISSGFWNEALVGLYASAIGFLFAMVAQTLGSVLTGLQRYDLSAKVSVLRGALLTIGIVAILFIGGRLEAVILWTAAFAPVTLGIYFVMVRKELPTLRIRLTLDRVFIRKLFGFSGYVFISKVSSLFGNYIVRFVVSFFLGPAAVTLYVVPSKLLTAFSGTLSNAFGVIFPFASEQGSLKQSAKIRKTFMEGSKAFAVLAVPIFLGIAIYSKSILTCWMGADFADKAWKILSFLSFASLFSCLTIVPNLVTFGLGHSKVIAIFSAATILLYATMLPPLTQTWGVEGTALAMLMATAPGVFLVGYEAKRLILVNVREYLLDTLGFHLLPIGMSLMILVLPRSLVTSTNLLGGWGLALFLVSYFMMMFVLRWLPDLGLLRELGWRLEAIVKK